MRRAEYVYAAAKYYRSIFDSKRGDISPLMRTFNRGNYTTGLAFGQDKNFLSTKTQSHIGEKIGTVKKIVGQKILVDLKENLGKGSAMKILRSGEEVGNAVYKDGAQGVFDYKGEPKIGDDVCVTTDTSLILPENKLLPITVDVQVLAEKPITAAAAVNGEKIEIKGGISQTSKTKPLTAEKIIEIFEKVDKYPFLPKIKAQTKDAFVPISTLNQFRRNFYSLLYNKVTEMPPRKKGNLILPQYNPKQPKNRKIAVIDSEFDFDLSKINIAIFAPIDYKSDTEFEAFFDKTVSVAEKYLYLAAFLTEKDVEIIGKNIEKFDGIYCENLAADSLAKKWNKKIFYGTGANVFNSFDIADKDGYVCLSNELTKYESAKLDGENIFVHAYGGIALMNYIYCPFEKKCEKCSVKKWSTLTDESGREFALRRYILDGCRFQLFNCLPLAGEWSGNTLINMLSLNEKQKRVILQNFENSDKVKALLGKYTTGHTTKPVK